MFLVDSFRNINSCLRHHIGIGDSIRHQKCQTSAADFINPRMRKFPVRGRNVFHIFMDMCTCELNIIHVIKTIDIQIKWITIDVLDPSIKSIYTWHSARRVVSRRTDCRHFAASWIVSTWIDHVETIAPDCQTRSYRHFDRGVFSAFLPPFNRRCPNVLGSQVLKWVPSWFVLTFINYRAHFYNCLMARSGNRNVFRHVKSLLVSGFLIYSASIGLYFLWSTYGGSTWLLAVTGFGLEAVIKIIISLTLYGLFLVDSSRSDWWHKMDDYVYRLK